VAAVAEPKKAGPKNVEAMMMMRLGLAGTVLALSIGLTASAVASDHRVSNTRRHIGRSHHAAFDGAHHVRHSRFEAASAPTAGGFVSLGPLGFTAACGTYPRGHGYCGPTNGAPIDAWSY
jgi:hypothetical protein